jgi:outer membrane protein assembly factor BamB
VDWQWLRVVDGMLLAGVHTYNTGQPYSVYAVNTRDGNQPWDRPVADGDSVFVAGSRVVYVDNKNHKLTGLDPPTGSEKWSRDIPQDQYGSAKVQVLDVLSDADLARPGDFTGAPDAGQSADTRLVLVAPDRSVRVIDAATGDVKATQANVGDPDDEYLAYGDRLYVAKTGSGSGYSVVSYRLDTLKGNKLVYQSGDSAARVQVLAPCGGRVCLLDQTRSDDKTTQLRVVDPDGGKVLWSRAVANAQSVTAVGDRIVVNAGTSTVVNKLYDASGKLLLDGTGDPVWVRINAGSLLLFSESTSDYGKDVTVAGLSAQSAKKTVMGVLREVRSSSCGWTDTLLVCARDSDFAIWKITG